MPYTLRNGVRALSSETSRRLVVRSIRLAAIAFAALICLNIFLLSTSSLSEIIGFYLDEGAKIDKALMQRPSKQPSFYDDDLWNEAARIVTGSDLGSAEHLILKIEVDEQTARATYLFSGPGETIDRIVNLMEGDPGASVDKLFGAVTINGNRMNFKQLEVDPNSTDKVSTIVMQSETIPFHYFLIMGLAAPPKTKHLHFAAKDIELESVVPVEQTIELYNISRTLKRNTLRITDPKVDRSSFEISLSTRGTSFDQPLAAMMERTGLLSIPFAGDLAETLLWAVPYLLLLVLVPRVIPNSAESYRKVVLLIVLLECGVTFLQATHLDLGKIAQTFPWVQTLLSRITASQDQNLSRYQQTIDLAIIMFAGIFWPNLVNRVVQPRSSTVPRAERRRRLWVLLALLASFLLSTSLFIEASSSSVLTCMALLLAALTITFIWFLWEFFSFWEALGKALLGALVVVFLGVCVGLPNFADSRESYTWLLRTIYIIISVASGVRISLAFLKLCPLLLPSELLNHILSQKWLTLLLALMLCFPAAWIPRSFTYRLARPNFIDLFVPESLRS